MHSQLILILKGRCIVVFEQAIRIIKANSIWLLQLSLMFLYIYIYTSTYNILMSIRKGRCIVVFEQAIRIRKANTIQLLQLSLMFFFTYRSTHIKLLLHGHIHVSFFEVTMCNQKTTSYIITKLSKQESDAYRIRNVSFIHLISSGCYYNMIYSFILHQLHIKCNIITPTYLSPSNSCFITSIVMFIVINIIHTLYSIESHTEIRSNVTLQSKICNI